MRLYLVRHGETDWNLENRFQGWADRPLSPSGEEQARELARSLRPVRFDAAYSSDLRRAASSAEILLAGRDVEPVRVKGFREMRIGELDGLNEAEILARFPGLLEAWRSDPAGVVMPGGEDLGQLQERVWGALEPLLERHPKETVLLVAHHSVNKTILCRVLDIPLGSFRTLRQPPCAVSVIDFLPGRAFVRAVNLNWRERTNVWLDLDEETKERVRAARAFLFDLDGVLLDSMPYYNAAWRCALAEWGVLPPEIEFFRRESEGGENSVRYFFGEAGREADGETVRAVVRRVGEIFRGFGGISPLPGAFEVCQALRAGGRRLALVTGSARPDVEQMLSAEQLGLFEVAVMDEDVERSKPDPEPYATALERLALRAGDAVVIENAPLGIRSARAAGLLTVGLTSTLPPEELHEADLVIDSLERLLGWLCLPAPVDGENRGEAGRM